MHGVPAEIDSRGVAGEDRKLGDSGDEQAGDGEETPISSRTQATAQRTISGNMAWRRSLMV